VSSFLEKELKKFYHSAKVIAKNAITEKRQEKRRGCPIKKNLKSAIRTGK